MADGLILLLQVNAFVAVAVVLVMALRLPVRRLFGPAIAYRLWILAPLAALAMLAPARVMVVEKTPAPAAQMAFETLAAADAPPSARADGPDPWLLFGGLWIAGALAGFAHLSWRQMQFGRAMGQGRAGPALVGFFHPRVVTPADFAHRYTPREQLVVLEHERTHLVRQDSRINGLVALARCINWFNPLIHLLAHVLRVDQELACDAQVVARHPTARRAYAEAMLKAQLAARPLPIGCYWPAPSVHPLAERIRLLSRKAPGRLRRGLGTAAVALLALAVAGAAWAARPAKVVMVEPPAEVRATASLVAAPVYEPSAERPAPVALEPPPAAAIPTPAAAAEASPAPAQTQPSFPGSLAAAFTELTGFTPDRDRRIYAVARRSAVQPGYAVRVLATMTDPDGFGLTTDMTAFGSQSRFRTGYYRRDGSRYALFTSVEQRGGLLVVTASLDRRFSPAVSGSIVLKSGETGEVVLGNGQRVTVTPTLRQETPREVEAGGRERRRYGDDL